MSQLYDSMAMYLKDWEHISEKYLAAGWEVRKIEGGVVYIRRSMEQARKASEDGHLF